MTYSIDYLTKHNRRKIRSIFAVPVSETKYEGKCLVRRGGAIIIRFIQEVGYDDANIVDGFYYWDFDFFRIYVVVDEIKENPKLIFDENNRTYTPNIWLSVRRVMLPGDTKTYKTPRIYIIYAFEHVRVKLDETGADDEWEYINKCIYFPYLRYPRIHQRRFFKRMIMDKFGWSPKQLCIYPKVIKDESTHEIFPLTSPFDLETYKDVLLSKGGNIAENYNISNGLKYFIVNNTLEYLDITQKDVDKYVEEENNRKHKVVRYDRA